MAAVDANADVHALHEKLLAIRNAVKLGAALLCTWGIALAVRFVLPRYLGPALFGQLNFADAFTAAFFIALDLGVDTYIRKEIAVHPEHASDFYGGAVVLRLLGAALIFVALAATLRSSGRFEVWPVVFVFGLAQLFMIWNGTLSALLHARGRVDGMSILSVVTKLIWGGGIVFAMTRGAGLWAYALSLLASEVVKTAMLSWLAHSHLGLVFRVSVRPTIGVLVASFPYYLNGFAHTAAAKLDQTALGFLVSEREQGWYGAANTLAGITLLITPLIGWVLMPMFSRAAARSEEALFTAARRAMELLLVVAIPTSLALSVGADVWVRIAFGKAFAPAAMALRLQAPMFVIMYVSIVCCVILFLLNRPWIVTLTSVVGLVLTPGFCVLLAPRFLELWGPGGAGAGAALSRLIAELAVLVLLIYFASRRIFDAQSIAATAKSLGACAVVIIADRFLSAMGPWRLLLEAALYLLLVIGSGGVRVREMAATARQALLARRQEVA